MKAKGSRGTVVEMMKTTVNYKCSETAVTLTEQLEKIIIFVYYSCSLILEKM